MRGISWLVSVSRGCGVSPGWDLSVGDVGYLLVGNLSLGDLGIFWLGSVSRGCGVSPG